MDRKGLDRKGLDRKILALFLCVCMTAVSSCGLLPEEEEHRWAPMISTEGEGSVEFQLASAQRGDMILAVSVGCTYVPAQTQSYAYSLDGVYFDKAFVEVGESVQKGQLLAQLEMESLREEQENCNRELETLEMRISFLEENRGLALERKRLEIPQDDTQESSERLERALGEINAQYDLQRQALEDEKYLASLQERECEKELSKRRLYAGFDGTVTYVRKTLPGDRSVSGEIMVTVADSTRLLFRAKTVYWENFEPGEEVVVETKKGQYEAIVVREEDLGLPQSEKVPGKSAYVYFELKESAFELEDGDQGSVTLVLETRENVLKVPESAVTEAGEGTIVYYVDGNGMRACKPVEAGLYAEGMVEILSGLKEGENVIVN